jgi:16S rRNA processing protein RimM
MINLDHCILLGTLIKIHGVKGQLVLRLQHLDFDDIKEMGPVFIIIDNLPVPFSIAEYLPKGEQDIILTLDDIESSESAQSLIGHKLWIHKESIDFKSNLHALSDSEMLRGYRIIDIQLGDLGSVSAILDYNQNPLLQVMSGKKEILIPCREEFIRGIDTDNKILQVEIPRGLLDL